MARSEACAKIFRGIDALEKIAMLKKNAENLGFLGSFPFTPRERSRMMRMSVRTKNYFAYACTRERIGQVLEKYKGETWQS